MFERDLTTLVPHAIIWQQTDSLTIVPASSTGATLVLLILLLFIKRSSLSITVCKIWLCGLEREETTEVVEEEKNNTDNGARN